MVGKSFPVALRDSQQCRVPVLDGFRETDLVELTAVALAVETVADLLEGLSLYVVQFAVFTEQSTHFGDTGPEVERLALVEGCGAIKVEVAEVAFTLTDSSPALGQEILHDREEYIATPGFWDMVFLATDLIELVPLDPDNEVHVETYRRSRNEPEMRATGAYGECDTSSRARERINEEQNTENPSALCAIRAEETVVGWAVTNLHDSRAHAAYVGYYVLPDHWGNGYASDAARLLVTYAFDELNAHRVEASVQADNPASRRVLEKIGFQKEGTKRDAYYKQGEYKDISLWSLLDGEFTE